MAAAVPYAPGVTPKAAPLKASTRSGGVHAALRADILAGRLRPGQKLPFAFLIERYAASVGVIREALSRLAEEGLIVTEPQLGSSVTPLSSVELGHLTQARAAIEPLVLRAAIGAGDLAWESAVLAAHHRLDRTAPTVADDPQRLSDDWVTAHADFHDRLLAACPNPRLRSIASTLRDAGELYRRWSQPIGDVQGRDVAGEHRALLDAVLARDADAAAAALAAHIERTATTLLTEDATVEGVTAADASTLAPETRS
jgi:DNA-binding GntR family transcriptional regulator